MLKVRHSFTRKTLVLEFSGTVGSSQALRAAAAVACALREMGHGYTLIEAFRGGVKFSEKAAGFVGKLAATCYERARIWRVMTLTLDGGEDPGMRILHRTRWRRRVPEMEVERAGRAMELAAAERVENSAWG